ICLSLRPVKKQSTLPTAACNQSFDAPFAVFLARLIKSQVPFDAPALQAEPFSMKIHEYQAKTILAKYGMAIPRGERGRTRLEAEKAAHRLFEEGAKGVVVKAQIHAGGRGKGGGVKVAKNLDEAKTWADKILGMRLVTHQTGPEGKVVQRLLIEETLPIERELYLGIVVDRATARPVFIASSAAPI